MRLRGSGGMLWKADEDWIIAVSECLLLPFKFHVQRLPLGSDSKALD